MAFAGLVLLAVGMPFERIQPLLRGPGFVVTNLEALIALALGLWGGHQLLARRLPRWRTALTLPLGLLLIAALLSAVAAPAHQANAIKAAGRLFMGVAIFLMVVDLASTPRRATTLVVALAGAGGVVAALGLLEMLRWPPVLALLAPFREVPPTFGGTPRLSSVLPFPNPAALVLSMTGCFVLGLSLTAFQRRALPAAVAWAAVATTMTVALALTLSRGGLLGFGAGALGLAVGARRFLPGRWLATAGIVGAAVLAATALSNEALRVRLTEPGNRTGFDVAYVGPTEVTLPPNARVTVPVTVINTGRRTWAPEGPEAIKLGVHWLDEGGKALVWAGSRTPLPHAVAPGQQVAVFVTVAAPPTEGRYTLAWDLVQGEENWFAYWWIRTGQTRLLVVPHVQPTVGPTALLQQFQPLPPDRMPRPSPGRLDLWFTALRIGLERPWFGVGADNFRLVYGRYLGMADWDVRLHAHNIYLEFLADTGWPGLLLWLWLTLLSLRVSWRLVAGSREAWRLGIAGALIAWWAHSQVDVFIWATPTYVLFWMTLGLSVAADPARQGQERRTSRTSMPSPPSPPACHLPPLGFHLLTDPVTRGWAVVVAGNLARLTLGLVASVLIARGLGPADFGVYAVLGAVASITGVVADLGLTAAAVKRMAATRDSDPAGAQGQGQAYFWLRVGAAGLIVAFGVLLAGPLSQSVLGLPDGRMLLQLALLGVVATALSGSVNGIFQALRQFGHLSTVLILNSALTVLLAAGLVAVRQLTLVTTLVILGIGTSLASFALGWWLLPSGWSLTLPDRVTLRDEGRRLFAFGRWVWVANLFAMLTARLDVLLVNRWSDPATVGVYALALNLATKVDIVNHSLYTVLLPAASALASERTLGPYLRRSAIRSALISLAVVLLMPLARPLITFLYGPAYAPAIPLFRLLLGVVVLDVFTTPLLLLAFPLNQPKVLAAADAARAATLALSAAWLIPTYGPAGAVVARFGARVAGAVLTLGVLAWKRSKENGV